MRKKKLKIQVKLDSESRILPFITFKLEGVEDEFIALVDSGSEATLLDFQVAKKLTESSKYKEYRGGKMVLDGLGGSINEEQGALFSMIATIMAANEEQWEIPLMGATMDMGVMQAGLSRACNDKPVAMIIGSDTLCRLNAKIDYIKQQLELNGVLSDKAGFDISADMA